MEAIKEDSERKETTIAPLLNEGDLKLLSMSKVNLSQADILKMYVKNWGELDLKQRRRVMGHVNA